MFFALACRTDIDKLGEEYGRVEYVGVGLRQDAAPDLAAVGKENLAAASAVDAPHGENGSVHPRLIADETAVADGIGSVGGAVDETAVGRGHEAVGAGAEIVVVAATAVDRYGVEGESVGAVDEAGAEHDAIVSLDVEA